jgi:hypothetical protein
MTSRDMAWTGRGFLLTKPILRGRYAIVRPPVALLEREYLSATLAAIRKVNVRSRISYYLPSDVIVVAHDFQTLGSSPSLNA